MGQSLTGDLSFQKTTGGLKVVASNVELALGDNGSGESARGPPFLTLSNAAGELVITSSGVVAKLTGGVQLALDGVSLTGAFDLLVNTTGNPGTAGGTSLSARAVLPPHHCQRERDPHRPGSAASAGASPSSRPS